jgi:hypothetical protein
LLFASKVSKTFNAHKFVLVFAWNNCLPHIIRYVEINLGSPAYVAKVGARVIVLGSLYPLPLHDNDPGAISPSASVLLH